MNREQKATAVAEIAEQIKESEAVFAVDYRGISVTQIAGVRAQLREADTTFRVVKNSLTEIAADQAGMEQLKPLLSGPTALMFVRGDAASAAKAVATFNKETSLLEFKGGVLGGETLEIEQLRAISKLPTRQVLYGQLVGIVASPITGLARSLGGLLGGLAIALGQVNEKKASGELPAGDAPAGAEPAAQQAPADAEAAPAAADEGAPAQQGEHSEDPAEGADDASAEPQAAADDSTTSDNENEADASGE